MRSRVEWAKALGTGLINPDRLSGRARRGAHGGRGAI